RHTRFSRDWSSDVCSSDLQFCAPKPARTQSPKTLAPILKDIPTSMKISFDGKYKSITQFVWNDIPEFVVITGPNGSGKSQLLERSEERRVGKECRSSGRRY